MNPFDTPTSAPKEKITGKHIAIVVVLAVLIMLPFAGLIYKQRADEVAKAEAARVAELQKKTIAAMMVNLPQRPKGRIAKGTVGHGELLNTTCFPSSAEPGLGGTYDFGNPPYLSEGFGEYWHIDGDEFGNNINTPNGWSATPEGVITVPAGAKIGANTMFYYKEGACAPEAPLNSRTGVRRTTYQFNVVNAKSKYTAVRMK